MIWYSNLIVESLITHLSELTFSGLKLIYIHAFLIYIN